MTYHYYVSHISNTTNGSLHNNLYYLFWKLKGSIALAWNFKDQLHIQDKLERSTL